MNSFSMLAMLSLFLAGPPAFGETTIFGPGTPTAIKKIEKKSVTMFQVTQENGKECKPYVLGFMVDGKFYRVDFPGANYPAPCMPIGPIQGTISVSASPDVLLLEVIDSDGKVIRSETHKPKALELCPCGPDCPCGFDCQCGYVAIKKKSACPGGMCGAPSRPAACPTCASGCCQTAHRKHHVRFFHRHRGCRGCR
jgi:hypothetical protein